MTDVEKLHDVAYDLRRLVAASPVEKAELDAWYERSAEIRERLLSYDVPIPVQVFHYLNDADVRIKDLGYRGSQEAIMREFIDAFDRGEIPASRGTTISLSPWSLAVLAALLILVVVLILRSCTGLGGLTTQQLTRPGAGPALPRLVLRS